MEEDPILRGLLARRQELDGHFAAFQCPSWLRKSLTAELESLRRLESTSDWPALRRQLITILAVAYGGLRDLGLETVEAAQQKKQPS